MMDGGNENETKNPYSSNTVKKKQNYCKTEKLIQFQDDGGINNEPNLNQNKDKAKFTIKDNKNEVEKPESKRRENNSKEKYKNNADATTYNKNSHKDFRDTKSLPVVGKPDQKKMKPKRSFRRIGAEENILPTEENGVPDGLNDEETFELEDILKNSRILELIQDLVNCFTSNSTLPENELQTLKVSLFARTCHVFLSVLNSCVKKTYARVINTDFLQEFKKKVESKKDACCQTSFSEVTEM